MRVKVTYQRVLEVYLKLKDQGVKITNQRVMDELGEGSFTTVYKFLKEIKERDEKNMLFDLSKLTPLEQIEMLNKEFNVSYENYRTVTQRLVESLQRKVDELTVENEELIKELKKFKEWIYGNKGVQSLWTAKI